jgi:hypothetical protein
VPWRLASVDGTAALVNTGQPYCKLKGHTDHVLTWRGVLTGALWRQLPLTAQPRYGAWTQTSAVLQKNHIRAH